MDLTSISKLIKDIFNLITLLIFFTFAITVAINLSLGKYFTNSLKALIYGSEVAHYFPRCWNQKFVLLE